MKEVVVCVVELAVAGLPTEEVASAWELDVVTEGGAFVGELADVAAAASAE